jgi:hypothetical protein
VFSSYRNPFILVEKLLLCTIAPMTGTLRLLHDVTSWVKVQWKSQERGWQAVVLALLLLSLVGLGDLTIPW